MKTLLLILALAISVSAQTLEWKTVTKGESVDIYVAEIARGPEEVKFWMRFDFPNGPPEGAPVSNLGSIRAQATFNCVKQTAKLTKGYGFFYDPNGNLIKKAKDNQTVGTVPASVGRYIVEYFCERPSEPSAIPPTLKPKP